MGALIDITGNVYGRLTVISKCAPHSNKARWLCQCECGQEKMVISWELRHGKVRSCGCLQREAVRARSDGLTIDETGNVYGALTVIRRVPSRARRNSRSREGARWLVLCSCGVETTMTGNQLRRGARNCASCGQKKAGMSNRKFDREESTWRSLYKDHTSRTKRYGCLPFAEWKRIVQQPCHYCGAEARERTSRCGDPVLAHGIDRIDSSKGYSFENAVPCCMTCNRAKRDFPLETFLEMCRKVAARHPGTVWPCSLRTTS